MALIVVSGTSNSWPEVPDPEADWGALAPLTETRHADPASWPSNDTAGFYYVEPDYVGANTPTNTTQAGDLTDSNGNRYGYPDWPRTTPPFGSNNDIAAGSLIYIKGGTYEQGGGGLTVDFSAGTEANPIWVVGDASDKPVFTGSTGKIRLLADSSYVFFEYLEWDFESDNQCSAITMNTGAGGANHICGRNLRAYGDDNVSVGNNGAFGLATSDTVNRNSEIIFVDCEAGPYGQYENVTNEDDCLGFSASRGIDNMWFIRCHGHHLGGDAFRPGTNESTIASPTADNRSKNIFYIECIGEFCAENAVDVKHSDHVVFYDCIFRDIIRSSTDPTITSNAGNAVVAHEEAPHAYFVKCLWERCGWGVSITDSAEVHIIDPIFRDMSNVHGGDGQAQGYCVQLTQGSQLSLVGAIMVRCGGGMFFGSIPGVGQVVARNNITIERDSAKANVTRGSHDIWMGDSTTADRVDTDYNIYESGNVSFQASTTNYSSVSAYDTARGFETNSIEGTPLMVDSDEPTNNFRPVVGSIAVDAADPTEPAILQQYRDEFSVPYSTDRDGTERNSTVADREIGAYEL